MVSVSESEIRVRGCERNWYQIGLLSKLHLAEDLTVTLSHKNGMLSYFSQLNPFVE